MMALVRVTILMLFASAASSFAADVAELDCKPDSVCRDPVTKLPARVLTRAFANVYKSEDESAGNILAENVRAFTPLYIFERKGVDLGDPANPKGWYRVGESATGTPLGWMLARDIVEWRQAIIVAFTHPGVGAEQRHPVLMFDDEKALKAVAESDDAAGKAQALYQQIDKVLAGGATAPDGVISMEPKAFVDIREKFYMLPVLQFEQVERGDEEARYLQVVAVTRDRAAPGSESTLGDTGYRDEVAHGGLADTASIAALGIDIVFVMDLTSSMGPFINETRLAMTDLVRLITKQGVAEKLKFGLVGYRDDVKLLPGVEFTTKNFTPELLAADDFLEALQHVSQLENPVVHDYQEEVFAGVKDALGSHWTEPALRFFVLVGDASSHPVGHPQNTTNLDENALRQQLNADKVNLIAVHLLDERAAEDHPLAKQQFSTLATNPGLETPAYVEIDTKDTESFQRAVKAIGETFTQMLTLLRKGDVETIAATAGSAITPPASGAPSTTTATTGGGPGASAPGGDTVEQARAATEALGYAALVPYLGKEAQPPRDITAWVFDHDLEKGDIPSLDVRVLLTKQQVNDLVFAVEKVLQALKRADLTQMKFFEALSGIAVETSKGEKINYENAKKLGDTGLLDSWIASLPYKSQILSMSNEFYAALGAPEKADLENSLDAKLQGFQDLINSDKWIALNERDPPTSHVYPLELLSLP